MPRGKVTTNLTTVSNGRARTIESDHATEVQFHGTSAEAHVRVKFSEDGALLVQVLRMVDGDWRREGTIEVPAPSPACALAR